MVKYKQRRGGRQKNSKSLQIMHKALENIKYNGIGGVVNYYFSRERFNCQTEESYTEESITKANINSEIFIGDRRGKKYKRTSQEVLMILQDTCDDLGATHFTVE